jgi:hypothetical protein
LRATGASVIPVAKQGTSAENLKYVKSYIKSNTRKNKHNKDIEYTPNILKSRSITEKDFNAFVDKVSKSYPEKGRPQLTVQQWYPRIWDREDRNNHSPKQSVVEVNNFRQSFSTDEAEVKLIRPRFGADNFDIKYQFANDIKFDVFGADNYYAEVLGETEQLASHILGSHSYDHWRISQRGATYIASGWERDEKTVQVRVPKAEKFFASWYKNQTNIDIELSTPGKVAKQMLKKLGGPDRVRVLSNEGILELIQSTVGNGSSAPTLTSKKLMSELGKIANKSEMWDAKGLLNWLLHIGALELGTEIQCPHCDKHNWYPLNRLDNTLVCEKCLDEYEVPKDNPQQGLVWTYSLVGPFRQPKMADGAFTTLLSLYFLNETMHFSITPHLSFQQPKGTDIEADFGLLIQDRGVYGSKVSTALGECKSFKGKFEARDVNRMKKMAKDLDDPILVFATLKNKLDKGEQRRLLQLLESQRKARFRNNGNKSRLLILTGNELFSDRLGLDKQWSKLTKKHQAMAGRINYANMNSLCDATQQIYLSSQSESDWLDEVFKRKRETAKVKEV